MPREYSTSVAERLKISPSGVKEVIRLFADGATVPFIARYRKEATGSLDEVQILAIRTLVNSLKELDARRTSIITALEKNNQLSAELLSRLSSSDSLAELEDLYLPYRPKRKTRAAIAKERGLLPLAEQLFKQAGAPVSIETYLCAGKRDSHSCRRPGGSPSILLPKWSVKTPRRERSCALFSNHRGLVRSTVVAKNRDRGTQVQGLFRPPGAGAAPCRPPFSLPCAGVKHSAC